MRTTAIAALLVCAACAAESHGASRIELPSADDDGSRSSQQAMPTAMGAAGAATPGASEDMPAVVAEAARFDPNGRWTSSDFEDPFELQLVAGRDGTMSGRVCSADLSGAPTVMPHNCGVLAAAWKANNLIHFDFEIPWTGLLPSSVRYQFVGAPGASPDVFTGVLMISGNTFPITFTRCPADRAWCS